MSGSFPVMVGGCDVRRNVRTIIIDERPLLCVGLIVLLHDTRYKCIASIAAASDIPGLKLSPGRALLTVLGVSRGPNETLRAVQRVRQAIKVCKIVAIDE